jgi:hypothetical protein
MLPSRQFANYAGAVERISGCGFYVLSRGSVWLSDYPLSLGWVTKDGRLNYSLKGVPTVIGLQTSLDNALGDPPVARNKGKYDMPAQEVRR